MELQGELYLCTTEAFLKHPPSLIVSCMKMVLHVPILRIFMSIYWHLKFAIGFIHFLKCILAVYSF